MIGLNADEMTVVSTTITESVLGLLGNLAGTEAETTISGFLHHAVLNEKPYMVVTPDGLRQITTVVFTNEVVRDFILTLSYQFFSRWCESHDAYLQLASNLAHGCSARYIYSDLDAMPDVIGDRLVDFETAYTLLQANKWLVIVLLLQNFVNVRKGGIRSGVIDNAS